MIFLSAWSPLILSALLLTLSLALFPLFPLLLPQNFFLCGNFWGFLQLQNNRADKPKQNYFHRHAQHTTSLTFSDFECCSVISWRTTRPLKAAARSQMIGSGRTRPLDSYINLRWIILQVKEKDAKICSCSLIAAKLKWQILLKLRPTLKFLWNRCRQSHRRSTLSSRQPS